MRGRGGGGEREEERGEGRRREEEKGEWEKNHTYIIIAHACMHTYMHAHSPFL